jgi:glycosyltransferase involved in cell wall biosynthesis
VDISVAMATYNGATYLPYQLESLAAQTKKPAELVICDDRSSDATPEIVRSFARHAPFPVIFVANPQRLHYADNFLKAAGLCTSDHVAFCDQDDVWRPHKLATVAHALKSSGACLVAHKATNIDATGQILGEFSQTDRYGLLTGADLHPWTFYYGFTCTFRRQLLELIPADSRPIDLIDPRRQLAHDRWVAFLAAVYGDIYFIAESLAEYRHHSTNASGWMRKPRGVAGSLRAARQRFGYHLLRQLLVTRGLVEVLHGLVTDQRRLGRLPSAERALEMLAYWTVFEERCAARYRIVERDRMDQRLRRLTSAVADHTYRNAVDGSVSYRMLVEDAVVSMLARPGQPQLAAALLGTDPIPDGAAAP